MSDNERKLLRLAREGSVEAFEELTAAYQRRIFNIVLKNCGSGYDASTLAQEVFVRTFVSLRHQTDDSLFVISLYKNLRDVCEESRRSLQLIS